MSYPKATHYSNSEIDHAGECLISSNTSQSQKDDSLAIVNNWRAAHLYPMNTFTSTLHDKTKKYPDAIIAQRLKRLPTIIEKLDRFSDMRLSQMQDIGGVRAILKDVRQVMELESIYLTKMRFGHKLKGHPKDYITNPKSDGYRGYTSRLPI